MTRRPKGTGSISYRADRHRYEGLLRIGGRSYRVHATTPEEVDAKLRHVRADVERGLVAERAAPLTVERYLRDWLSRRESRLEASTVRGYTTYIERHIVPALGSRQLATLTPKHVQDLIDSRKLAPASIRQLRAVLRKALHDAERQGLISRNVVRLTEGPRVRKHMTEPLTPGQAKVLLARLAGDHLEAVYAVGVGCGLRLGEVLGLKWSDVEEGVLTVRRSLQRVKGSYVLKEYPKTDESQRRLAIPPFVWQALDRQREAQKAPGDWGLVFTTATGAPVNGTWVTHHLYDVLTTAKLPRQSFHDLRHAFASILIDEGADLKEVKDVLGHAQVSLTANLYGHLYQEAKQRAADRVQRAIG